MSILQEIVDKRRLTRTSVLTLSDLRARLHDLAPPRDFLTALRKSPDLSVIAEIKFRSPSEGILRDSKDVAHVAQSYASNGASALSVLTEQHYFDGSQDYIALAKAASQIPVLRKDFLFDEYDIILSRVIGADAILLIAKLFSPNQIADLAALARSVGLAVLLELHDEDDLARSHGISGVAWGVNHRNLETLAIDLNSSARLFPLLPDSDIKVAESGISTPADLALMKSRGADAVLIGTSLMKQSDPGLALSSLLK